MVDVRMMTLEEALEGRNYRPLPRYQLLQLRWESKARVVTYAWEDLPWLIFHGFKGAKLVRISLKGEEYGKTWRCFDMRSNQEQMKLIPWEDGEGMWTPEEDPEAEEE